jgi:hypothetical protein
MTNIISTSMILIVVAVAAACFGRCTPFDEVPYPGKPFPGTLEILGTVQRIDSQTVTILVRGASRPERWFEWNSRCTNFFCDGAPATVDSLRVGTYVHLDWSYNPLNGRGPFAHRIFWDTSTSPKKSNPER